MDLHIPYAKTDLAWSVIRQRGAQLNSAMRALLIMMDGKKPLMELMPTIKALSLKMEDVHVLLDRGLVQPCPAPTLAPTHAWVQPSARHTPPASPGHGTPPNKSLAAAKFYALDQVARILGRDDEHLRLAARQVVDRNSLMDWLSCCQGEIARRAGDDRAQRFIDHTLALMPGAGAGE